MKTTSRPADSVALLGLGRRLTIEADLMALELTVEGLLQDGCGGLALDFGGMTRLDAAGLGELVRLRGRVLEAGGRLCLLNVPRREKDLLDICRLSSVFQVLDNEGEALANLRSLPPRRSPVDRASRSGVAVLCESHAC